MACPARRLGHQQAPLTCPPGRHSHQGHLDSSSRDASCRRCRSLRDVGELASRAQARPDSVGEVIPDVDSRRVLRLRAARHWPRRLLGGGLRFRGGPQQLLVHPVGLTTATIQLAHKRARSSSAAGWCGAGETDVSSRRTLARSEGSVRSTELRGTSCVSGTSAGRLDGPGREQDEHPPRQRG